MTEATQAPMTLTLDGQEYPIDQFSDKVKRLVAIFRSWEAETVKERLSVAKGEAALRDLTREIEGLVKAELEAQAAPANEEAAPVAEGEVAA